MFQSTRLETRVSAQYSYTTPSFWHDKVNIQSAWIDEISGFQIYAFIFDKLHFKIKKGSTV